MMNVGSPKLLVISDSDPVDEQEDEEHELGFTPLVGTHREKLHALLLTLLSHLLSLLALLRTGVRRLRDWRRRRVSEDAATAEEEGRGSEGSFDHTHQQAEPEVTPEALQLEMEAATPLPGENVTTPPGDKTRWAPHGQKDEEKVDPTTVPLPASHTSLSH